MNQNMHNSCDSTTGYQLCHSGIRTLVWNVRGAGSKEFLNTLKEHMRMHKPQILALLKTHISGLRADEVCNKIGFRGQYHIDVQGFQGGIWLLWDSDEVWLNLVQSHRQFVTMEVTRRGIRPWLFTAVYASPIQQIREELWTELSIFAGVTSAPWMLAGDFNETRNLDERDHGGRDMARRCAIFNNWIENNGLLDFGYSGPRSTWSRGNRYDTKKNSRLVRALCNASWRTQFHEGAVRHLVWNSSDQCPILISTNGFTPIQNRTNC